MLQLGKRRVVEWGGGGAPLSGEMAVRRVGMSVGGKGAVSRVIGRDGVGPTMVGGNGGGQVSGECGGRHFGDGRVCGVVGQRRNRDIRGRRFVALEGNRTAP
jgi:hypothetical protein